MYYRDRLAPVSLTVERPVLHLVLYTLFAAAEFCKYAEHLFDSVLLVSDAVQLARIHHLAVARVGFLRDVAALDNLDYINAELLRKFIVTGIVSRNRHYSARAVSHHYIVGNVYRNFLAGNGVYAGKTVYLYARLVLDKLCSFKLALFTALRLVSVKVGNVLYRIPVLFYYGMLGSDNHKCYAVERVGTGRVDAELLAVFLDGEVYESACRLAYPVLLLELYVRQIIDRFKSL